MTTEFLWNLYQSWVIKVWQLSCTFQLVWFQILIFMYLGLQLSTCLISDTWFSCALDYKFQLVLSLILQFHVPWITSFNFYGFFLLHSEHINLFVYTLNRKFQLVSWLFTKSKSANYFQKLLFFFKFQIQLNIKISKLAEL